MGIEDTVRQLRSDRLETREAAVPDTLQGVAKTRVAEVLSHLGYRDKPDLVDATFALLDDETPSWFPAVADSEAFNAGATTAHIMCHVGILQRGKNKLDREQGRDYILKPLAEIGVVEAVTLKDKQWIPGHTSSKSPNSAYRLTAAVLTLLKADDEAFQAELAEWASEDAARQRRALQAEAQELAQTQAAGNKHPTLIRAAIELYVPRFHPGFEVLYVDDKDGVRVTEAHTALLKRAGVEITLDDSMPDVLLWNPTTDELWVIEAVTSDGEVDSHKVRKLNEFAAKHGKASIGYTTAYMNWKAAALRQDAQHNLAPATYVWVMSDPARRLLVQGSA